MQYENQNVIKTKIDCVAFAGGVNLMKNSMLMDLRDIQPSQLYINSQKLNNVLDWFNPADHLSYEPLPVINLDGKIVFTDGHTRALCTYLKGIHAVSVYWDKDEIDEDSYRSFVKWCVSEGINSIADLSVKIIKPEEYQVLWIERCSKV